MEKLNTCLFLPSWGTCFCKVLSTPTHRDSIQPLRESEYSYMGSVMYELHENKKTRIHGNNSLFLIPPTSCSAMCSKYIKHILSSVKNKLEHGTQDNQVTEVSVFTSLYGTLKRKLYIIYFYYCLINLLNHCINKSRNSLENL